MILLPVDDRTVVNNKIAHNKILSNIVVAKFSMQNVGAICFHINPPDIEVLACVDCVDW